jgi:hypothetical protein
MYSLLRKNCALRQVPSDVSTFNTRMNSKSELFRGRKLNFTIESSPAPLERFDFESMRSKLSDSVTPPCKGRDQITIRNDSNKWYFGTYSRPNQPHLHSFNRALYS